MVSRAKYGMTNPYGFIYITENLLNGKKYIGQRSYDKPRWEEYLGSGKLLRRAIVKHGRENFSRTILYEAFTKEALDEAEIKIIALHDAVNDPMFYNLVPGGHGVSMGFTGKQHTPETRERMRQAALGHPVSDHVRKIVAENGRKNIHKALAAYKAKGYEGATHPRAKPVTIHDVTYPTFAEAMKAGYNYVQIQRALKGEPLSRSLAKSVIVEGVHFSSIAEAMRELCLTRREIRRLIAVKPNSG